MFLISGAQDFGDISFPKNNFRLFEVKRDQMEAFFSDTIDAADD